MASGEKCSVCGNPAQPVRILGPLSAPLCPNCVRAGRFLAGLLKR